MANKNGDTMTSSTGATAIAAQCYDVVVVGAGPAGLTLATCLARWGYRIKHIDNRPEPTPTGRADGIQSRSLDLLRNLGLKADLMALKPARAYEVAFWGLPTPDRGISRIGTWPCCPSFIGARYPFTTVIHQGHVEKIFLHHLRQCGVLVQRPWRVLSFETVKDANADYPITVCLEHVDESITETVRAKYLFGGDGAKSSIRQQLQINFQRRSPVEHIWGVIDGVVCTNFPDIKVELSRIFDTLTTEG